MITDTTMFTNGIQNNQHSASRDILVGFEVECPLYNNYQPVSALTLLPELSKEAQQEVTYQHFDGSQYVDKISGTFHPDNASMEMTTAPVGGTMAYRSSNTLLQQVLNEALIRSRAALGKSSFDETVFIHPTLVGTTYSSDELADPAHSVAGCSPSKNIYTSRSHAIRYNSNERFGGLHVNVDIEGTEEQKLHLVSLMDKSLGLMSVLSSNDVDAEQRRRELYGRAGEYRLPPFGVEYRTLPSSFSRDLHGNIELNTIASIARYLSYCVMNNDIPSWDKEIDGAATRAAINTVDKDLASKLLAPYIK